MGDLIDLDTYRLMLQGNFFCATDSERKTDPGIEDWYKEQLANRRAAVEDLELSWQERHEHGND